VLVGLVILAGLWRRTRRRERGAGDQDAIPAAGSAA
jgi:hypothetical protein